MRSRLVVLTGQTIALGAMVAFLVVPASALFLARYGADALPYAYLAVAVAGVAVTTAMRRAQSRVSLAVLAEGVLGAYLALVVAAWGVLAIADGYWVTFPLLVMFPLIIPIGFMLVGAQSGRLLDVRQMKAHLPRVFAGFSVGFSVGGLAAAALVDPLGGPEHLLGVDALTAACFLALVVETARRFPAELHAAPVAAPATGHPRAAVRAVLGNRLVLAVFGYQVLSAAATQLLDFLVWERAAARYPDAADLARFQGVFGAVINGVGLLFVVLVAGRLLTRAGICLGLVANPGAVALLVASGTAIGYGTGAETTIFFVVVCAQQVVDIALTDGMTRTSINATYQALPMSERLRAQTGVEAAGVPVALGLVGALLLVHQWLGLDVRVVEVATLVLALMWLGLAVWAHREYGAGLRRLVAQPPWVPASLQIRDAAQQAAVDRLLVSRDARDVAVGLTALNDTRQPWGLELVEATQVTARDVRAALDAEAGRVVWLLDTLAGLDGAPGCHPLSSALRDEIDVSAGRSTAVLALAHGHEEVVRAVTALSSTVESERGLALEMFEVTLGHGVARMALALVDPLPDDDTRRAELSRHLEPSTESVADRLRQLVESPHGDDESDTWLRACALYAAPSVPGVDPQALATRWVDDADPIVAETARWVCSAQAPC